jgi:hypothetical protein
MEAGNYMYPGWYCLLHEHWMFKCEMIYLLLQCTVFLRQTVHCRTVDVKDKRIAFECNARQ